MKYFKTKYDIPLFNWIMITENGFNLSYLKKNYKVKNREYKKLNNIYMNILDSLTDAKFDVLESYIKWQTVLTKYRAELLLKKNKEIINEKYNITINIEQVFRNYLEILEKYYTDFEITEFYFDKTQHKKFKELTGQEFKELNNFNDIKFYDFNQYEFFCRKYKAFYPLTMSEAFVKLFIKQRAIKIKSLIELDIMLSDIFTTYGKYNEYQFIRSRLFDLNRLKSEIKENHSGFEEVSVISQITGIQFDTKKITLAEFEAHKITANNIIASRKKEEPKPQANGRV